MSECNRSDPARKWYVVTAVAIGVAALNGTLDVIVGLIAIALLLSQWALRQERRLRAGQPASCGS